MCNDRHLSRNFKFDPSHFEGQAIAFLNCLFKQMSQLVPFEWLVFLPKLHSNLKKSDCEVGEYFETTRELHEMYIESQPPLASKRNSVSCLTQSKTLIKFKKSKQFAEFLIENEKVLNKYSNLVESGDLEAVWLKVHNKNSKFLKQFFRTQLFRHFCEVKIRFHMFGKDTGSFGLANDMGFNLLK